MKTRYMQESMRRTRPMGHDLRDRKRTPQAKQLSKTRRAQRALKRGI